MNPIISSAVDILATDMRGSTILSLWPVLVLLPMLSAWCLAQAGHILTKLGREVQALPLDERERLLEVVHASMLDMSLTPASMDAQLGEALAARRIGTASFDLTWQQSLVLMSESRHIMGINGGLKWQRRLWTRQASGGGRGTQRPLASWVARGVPAALAA